MLGLDLNAFEYIKNNPANDSIANKPNRVDSVDFVTNEVSLRHFIHRLPTSSYDLSFHFLIIGPAGGGKKTLARHAWKLFNSPSRPFCHVFAKQIHFERDINRIILKAKDGDLFVEDINNISCHLGKKLLIASKENNVRLIGSVTTSADNKSPILSAEISKYFSDIILIPTLENRISDISLIAREVLNSYSPQMMCSIEALKLLQKQQWSGQVKQLVYCLERSANLAIKFGCSFISTEILTVFLKDKFEHRQSFAVLNGLHKIGLVDMAKTKGMKQTVKLVEAALIADALNECAGCISQAAKALNVPINTLNSRIKVLSLMIADMEVALRDRRP